MDKRNQQLAGNTVILMIGKICTQFINFFMLPLYTAILAPEEYGIVDLFTTYVTLLLPIVSLHLDLGLFRFMLDCRDDQKQQSTLISSALMVNILCCVVFAGLFAIVQPLIHSEYKIFLLLHVVLNVFSSLLLQFARGLGHNGAYSIASIISAFVTVAMNILLVAVVRVGAIGLFWSIVCGQSAMILYLLVSQKIWIYMRLRQVHLSCLKPVLRYSIPLIPTNLAWWVVNASNRTVINQALGVAANGIFSVASKFSSLINVFYSIFNMAWTETVSLHIEDEDRESFLSTTVSELYNFFFGVCICIIAVMPFAFRFLVPNEEYIGAYPLIPILMLAVFFSIVCGLYSVVFLAKKDTKENAKTAVFAGIINLVVDLLLIRVIGLYAAALSTLLGYLVMAIYRYFSVRKYITIRISTKQLLISLLMTTIVVCTYYTGNRWLQGSILLATIIYTIISNRKMILGLVNSILSRLRKGTA